MNFVIKTAWSNTLNLREIYIFFLVHRGSGITTSLCHTELSWEPIWHLQMSPFIAPTSTRSPTSSLPLLALARVEFCPKICPFIEIQSCCGPTLLQGHSGGVALGYSSAHQTASKSSSPDPSLWCSPAQGVMVLSQPSQKLF